uniref:Uncharacterized protein n=1 Tax=Ditylenchus dipsaci TaxID=166011 RepID=A0A915CUH0_9BILA
MLLLQFLTAFACVVCNVQTASSSKELLLPFAIAGRPLFGFNGQHLRTHDADDTASEKYFTQNLNQSSQTDDAATFKQRYFVNTQWKGNANGAVHILYIEGDGPASVSKVKDVSLPHVALAKDLGATAWILEHRFYGKSQPFSNTTIKTWPT